MREFKEGDKVRALDDYYAKDTDGGFYKGSISTVVCVDKWGASIAPISKNCWYYKENQGRNIQTERFELVETKEKVVSGRRLFKRKSESSVFFTKGLLYELSENGEYFVEDDTGSPHSGSILWIEVNFQELLGDGEYTNEEIIDRIEKAIAKNSDLFETKVTEKESFGEFHAEEADLKASETQIAGNHYSKLRIQPMRYALENELNYGQANAVKYITRYKDKNGIEDLKKAIHCIELLIEFEEGES